MVGIAGAGSCEREHPRAGWSRNVTPSYIVGHVPDQEPPSRGSQRRRERRDPRPDRLRGGRPEQAGAQPSCSTGWVAQAGRADRLHGDPRRLPDRDDRRSGLRPRRPARHVRCPRGRRPVDRRLRPHPDRGRAAARRRRRPSSPPRCCAPRPPTRTRRARRPSRCSPRASRSGCRSSACPSRSAASPRSAAVTAGALVAEALAHGDLGLAVATLAPGAVATAIATWGSDEQQQTYLPAFTGDDVAAAALALTEPTAALRRPRAGHHRHPHRRRLPRPRRREVDGAARGRGRAVRRRRPARRRERALPGRVRRRRAHRRGRPVDGRPGRRRSPPSTLDGRPRPGRRGARRDRRHDVRRVRAALAPRLVCTRGRDRSGRARLRHAVRQGARGVRRADRAPPVGGVHGRRHRHRAPGDAAAHLEGRLAGGRRARTSPAEVALARTALRRQGDADRPRRRPAARRSRLRQGAPGGALVPRPPSDLGPGRRRAACDHPSTTRRSCDRCATRRTRSR